MKYLILFSFFGLVFSQEFEVDGNLKVQGDIIFSDASTMTSASSGIPAGILAPFAGSTAPDGWLQCDGSAVSRTTYSGLFAVIATTYGSGDGSTTFDLPDLRGRMALGLDNMGGTSADRVTNVQADAMGGADGEETHQLTEDEMPSRNDYISHEGGTFSGATGGTPMVRTVTAGTVGNDQPQNNMPPYMALNYIIKY
jgi:microcystin-dependent protein